MKLSAAKRLLILLTLCAMLASGATAQRRNRGYVFQECKVENGDTLVTIHLLPIRKYSRGKDMRRYARMIRAVKKVYPIAKEARREMALMEAELQNLPSKEDRELYTKGLQKRIVKEYTPVLKRMTIYEGQILLKLIDRETDHTAFQIIKEFRGGFVAGFWQAMAKLFGNNLKMDYDPEGDDRILHEIVTRYEKGLL